jgi:glycerol-3-phosphate dehydrogenase (NAD(P)+)
MKTFGFYGSGAWAIALAQNFSTLGTAILYSRDPQKAQSITEKKIHPKYPAIQLHQGVLATTDPRELKHSDYFFYVAPVQQALQCFEDIKTWLDPKTPVILCSKGLIQETGEFLTTALRKKIDNPFYFLSGPNFAHEVIQGLPAASTFSGDCLEKTKELCTVLKTRTLRLYASKDIKGVQLCGALKNVLAIACGILHAKNLGLNAYSTLITRGLAEMKRLGQMMGASPSTFLGLSGVGDVTLTCGSDSSRNTQLGRRLANATLSVEEVLKLSDGVAEGYYTAFAVEQLSKSYNCRMPIFQAVAQTLRAELSIQDAIHSLLSQQETYQEEE